MDACKTKDEHKKNKEKKPSSKVYFVANSVYSTKKITKNRTKKNNTKSFTVAKTPLSFWGRSSNKKNLCEIQDKVKVDSANHLGDAGTDTPLSNPRSVAHWELFTDKRERGGFKPPLSRPLYHRGELQT